MLPAILNVDIDGFGRINEKVYYKVFNEPKLKEKTGNEWYFEMKNASGKVVVTEADPSIFKMYRVK